MASLTRPMYNFRKKLSWYHHHGYWLVHLTLVSLLVGPIMMVGAFVPYKTSQRFSLARNLGGGSEPNLNVAVIGAGPAGLLLSHLLLQQENVKVTVLESRSDPRREETEQRAYALGLGIRGRTAIRQVDENLWQAVKKRGFESERFKLHIGGFTLTLRSEKDGKRENDTIEPSLLLFQSSLCAALTDELERRHANSNSLRLLFDHRVEKISVGSMTLDTKDDNNGSKRLGPFDLVIGCDGVNSVVRATMEEQFPAFQAYKEPIPGEYKVVRLKTAPPKVDPAGVALIFPKKGSTVAFFEPTGNDGSCCILFSGRANGPILSNTNNITSMMESLSEAFPYWEDFHNTIAEQLMSQKPGAAATVVCNTYHCGGKIVLVGDAAHATGGVSGQGVNSALMDSVALAQCLRQNRNDLPLALLNYSKQQVPEGKALYEISFGPKPKGLKAVRWALVNARDTLFRGRWRIGRPPIQTRLTTSLDSFSDMRRDRDKYYPAPFPQDSEFQEQLEKLHQQMLN